MKLTRKPTRPIFICQCNFLRRKCSHLRWTECCVFDCVGEWGVRNCSGGFHFKMDPKRKCCMTGNLPKTSALYIFHIPSLTFCQWGTSAILSSIGLFSANKPDFTFTHKYTPFPKLNELFVSSSVKLSLDNKWLMQYLQNEFDAPKVHIFRSVLFDISFISYGFGGQSRMIWELKKMWIVLKINVCISTIEWTSLYQRVVQLRSRTEDADSHLSWKDHITSLLATSCFFENLIVGSKPIQNENVQYLQTPWEPAGSR